MFSSHWIVFVCFLASFHDVSSEDSQDIKANPGDDVTLHCWGPADAAISLLRWRRPDLGSDEYVFYLRQNRSNEDFQHPSFHHRVELRDPHMKDGDASVILKKVTIYDTGTYECHVGITGRTPELLSTIHLKVEPVQINITAESGHTVTLSCRAPSNIEITAVEWTRPDLKPDYVFLFRDNQSDPENQHPSFKNRTELKDKQMKDGDVSLILKDVKIDDRGIYKCCVTHKAINLRRGSNFNSDPISIINLTVDPGHTDGHSNGNKEEKSVYVGLVIGLSVAVVVVVVAGVVFLIHRKPKGRAEHNSYRPPAKKEGD